MKTALAILILSIAVFGQAVYVPDHDYQQFTQAEKAKRTMLRSGHQAFATVPIGAFNESADPGFEVSSGLNIRLSTQMTMVIRAGYVKFETAGDKDIYAIPASLGFRRYLTTAYHGLYTGTEGGVMFFNATSDAKFFMAPLILGYEMDAFGVGVDPSFRIRFVADDRYHITAGVTFWFGE